MTIQTRLTLTFTGLTAAIVLSICLFVYYFSYRYTRIEFYQRLEERARLTAQVNLEKDEVSTQLYQEIRSKYLQALPQEREYLLPLDGSSLEGQVDSVKDLSPQFLQEVIEQGHATAQEGGLFQVGIYYQDNQGDHVAVTAAANPYGEAKLNNLRKLLLLSFGLSLGLTYLIGHYYARHVLAPISRIVQRAQRISAQNLDLRLDQAGRPDELGRLATTFNHMLDRLQTAFDIQTHFVNHASHELRTPLTVILGEIEWLNRRERDLPAYQAALSTIEQEAQRLDLLVNSLLRLAQSGADPQGILMASVAVDALLMQVQADLRVSYPDTPVELQLTHAEGDGDAYFRVYGHEGLLRVALSNLLDNALKFSRPHPVVLRLAVQAQTLQLDIEDQGIGISPEDLQQVTQPLYRGANVQQTQGYGMGLPLALKIIKLHGGQCALTSTVGEGTQVRVILPIAPPEKF